MCNAVSGSLGTECSGRIQLAALLPVKGAHPKRTRRHWVFVPTAEVAETELPPSLSPDWDFSKYKTLMACYKCMCVQCKAVSKWSFICKMGG